MVTASADTSYDGHSTSAKNQTWYVPNFYFTHQITDNLSAGVMVNSRFGLGNEYDKDWAGAVTIEKPRIRADRRTAPRDCRQEICRPCFSMGDALSVGESKCLKSKQETLETRHRAAGR